eukprot:CAMPEP_0180682288 /NCGR_PEP_ID=MMETSP1037_2-20121125/70473_1 /TAXON_ID=632150 /ORGANISM="Azadinium spinosum, Strain 3D9" /LENGTH=66 /DNA_ID=CAMNT_0022712263 /DNA_START=92 /DNA_END=289 /DNA_ORIENTATION=-
MEGVVVSDRSAVEISSDGTIGEQLVARQAFAVGEPVLVEVPAISWRGEDSEPEDALRFAREHPELL